MPAEVMNSGGNPAVSGRGGDLVSLGDIKPSTATDVDRVRSVRLQADGCRPAKAGRYVLFCWFLNPWTISSIASCRRPLLAST
jgi:hypothetical protein